MEIIAWTVPQDGGMRVLDAGCGTGELAEALSSHGFAVTALDLGFASIRRASKASPGVGVRYVQGDLYRLPFGDGLFDAVVVSEVAEHLERPSDALCEAARVLRPGGCLVVSTPYRERLRYTLCIHCNEKTPVNAHLHSFDESVMTGMLGDAGCRVDGVRKYAAKLAEYAGFPGLTWYLPRGLWSMIDRVFCAVTGRQSFMVVRAEKIPGGAP